MKLMEWTDGLELGLERMDDTHREFVDQLNALGEAGDEDMMACFDAFYAHAVAHFEQENEWMRSIAFPPIHCHTAEHEVEDVAAAVRLSEVGGEAVRPTVCLFEHIHRRRDLQRFRTALPITTPLIANLGLGMSVGEVLGTKAPHACCSQKQRIFDASTDPPELLAHEPLQEVLLILIDRRHQQSPQERF